MTTSMDHGDEFLQAEEEAHSLVDILSKLKLEVESYDAASGALQGAVGAIAAMTGTLGTASEGIASVVETLRRIGTPELLAAQRETSGQLNGLREQALAELGGLATRVESLATQLESMRTGEMAKLSESQQAGAAQVGELVERMEAAESSRQVWRERAGALLSAAARTESLERLRDLVEKQGVEHQRSLNTLRKLLIAEGVLVLLGLLVASALIVAFGKP